MNKKQIIKLNESDFHKIIKESVKRILKEGESGGWVVDSSEAQEAYNMFVNAIGEEEANAAIVRALGDNALSDVLAYLFRMYDFREWSDRDNDEDFDENDRFEHGSWMDKSYMN